MFFPFIILFGALNGTCCLRSQLGFRTHKIHWGESVAMFFSTRFCWQVAGHWKYAAHTINGHALWKAQKPHAAHGNPSEPQKENQNAEKRIQAMVVIHCIDGEPPRNNPTAFWAARRAPLGYSFWSEPHKSGQNALSEAQVMRNTHGEDLFLGLLSENRKERTQMRFGKFDKCIQPMVMFGCLGFGPMKRNWVIL